MHFLCVCFLVGTILRLWLQFFKFFFNDCLSIGGVDNVIAPRDEIETKIGFNFFPLIYEKLFKWLTM